jgi:hypothetical protein
MAYATTNPPALVDSPIARDNGGQEWVYISADVVGDVDAADYFSNGDALGMKVGDRVRVVDTTTPLVTDCWVSAVTSGGAATVTQDA